ncbi:hypothetical protein [Streptomyces sp. HC307]
MLVLANGAAFVMPIVALLVAVVGGAVLVSLTGLAMWMHSLWRRHR